MAGTRPRRRAGTAVPQQDSHIEVSKSRQILLVVHNGETVAYLPVSSGAGGITPVGNYRIRWKAPATTTWLGSAILYRTMTFRGNNYAIHGFPSVPAYPASHGCVRVPIWIADWLYQQSPVGEPRLRLRVAARPQGIPRGSSSASRRCTTDRERTPTSRPCSSTGARSTSASSSSR